MITIHPMHPKHAASVLRIYEQGLSTRQATFNTIVPSWDEWDAAHLQHSRLVALEGDTVAGWVALSPVSVRLCYKGVAELSIYILGSYRGKGVGNLLMQALINESEQNGIWTLNSSTFPENVASIKLQEKYGFRVIGYREKVAEHYGVWRDTVLLERRSKRVGTHASTSAYTLTEQV
nr:GNAT family N-acetyltransferase [uncultured Pontibacter sp.]